MTNKKAIEILEELPDRIISMLMPLDIDFDYKAALDLAIKTLEERPQGDLISRSVVKGMISDKSIPIKFEEETRGDWQYSSGVILSDIYNVIDNAPTVEVPENEVNCVLTMFGKCSYNETGCSDCEIKDKIRKALAERPQGECVTCKYRACEITEKPCKECSRAYVDLYEVRKGGAE